MSKNIRRHVTAKRAALLLMLLMLAVGLYQEKFSRSEAYVCYGVETTERYYSDATLSTLVGKCVENECKGTYVCTGTQTEFVTTSTRGMLCSRCDPMCGCGTAAAAAAATTTTGK